jgi:hypothetical protein
MNEIASAESNGYTTDIVVGYDEAVLTNGNEAYQLRFAASWTK